jgi:hypothetical protein
MANGDDSVSRTIKGKTSDKTPLPWRPFRDRPIGIWIDETVQRIKQTAMPEAIESLYRNHIPKDAKFRTLKHLITCLGLSLSAYEWPCPLQCHRRFVPRQKFAIAETSLQSSLIFALSRVSDGELLYSSSNASSMPSSIRD